MRKINKKINLLSRGFNYSCTEIGNILKWKYIFWLLAYIPHKGYCRPTIQVNSPGGGVFMPNIDTVVQVKYQKHHCFK